MGSLGRLARTPKSLLTVVRIELEEFPEKHRRTMEAGPGCSQIKRVYPGHGANFFIWNLT